MSRLLAIILLVACISCDHKPKNPEPSPLPTSGHASSGDASPLAQHARTHCIVISNSEAWSFNLGFEAEPVEVLGLRFEVRGKCGLARVAMTGSASPVVGSIPKLNRDGLLDAVSKSVEVYWEKPVPAGTKIAGHVDLAFTPPPAAAFPLCVTPLLSCPASATPIGAPTANHPYARFLQTHFKLMGTITDPENGLDTGAFSIDPSGAEVHSHQYIYHGWTLAPAQHTTVTFPIDVPFADGFSFTDILPLGVTTVHVEAMGFRITALEVKACVRTEDASGDVPIERDQNGAYSSPTGLADISIRFATPVDTESSGLLTIAARPVDQHVPLKGALHFSYQSGGSDR